MLNTDQHNKNVRKQHTPMSQADFIKNTSLAMGTDSDRGMLEAIYTTIKYVLSSYIVLIKFNS